MLGLAAALSMTCAPLDLSYTALSALRAHEFELDEA